MRRPVNNSVIILALLHGMSAHGEDPGNHVDTSQWQCNLCTYATGWSGTMGFGPARASDASFKFGDYRGIEDDGIFLSLDGDVLYRGEEGQYFDFHTFELGTHNRRMEIRGGRHGKYELRLGYREIPRYSGFGTHTPYTGSGSGALALPRNWVSGSSTAGLTGLDASLAPVAFHTLRKHLDAGLSLRMAGN
jgi:hypothetical protein